MEKNNPPTYDDAVKTGIPYEQLSANLSNISQPQNPMMQQPLMQQPTAPIQVQPQPIFMSPPATSSHTTVVVQAAQGGGCPVCRAGNLEKEYTCCGICLAIFCFPVGILCCLCMTHRKCNHCGAAFG